MESELLSYSKCIFPDTYYMSYILCNLAYTLTFKREYKSMHFIGDEETILHFISVLSGCPNLFKKFISYSDYKRDPSIIKKNEINFMIINGKELSVKEIYKLYKLEGILKIYINQISEKSSESCLKKYVCMDTTFIGFKNDKSFLIFDKNVLISEIEIYIIKYINKMIHFRNYECWLNEYDKINIHHSPEYKTIQDVIKKEI